MSGLKYRNMKYNEALEYIHSLERFGIRPGLERIERICDLAGNPQDSLRFIHVAGTNGKGSASTVAASILTESGYKTGLFTSPYVTDFRERIMIDGEMADPDLLTECIEEIKSITDKYEIPATEFEFITAAAFLYYKKGNCDYVVLEVGLGGRFDATNIIKSPEAAMIMSISFDHIAVLGNTIEKIAFEKCGIIKEKSKVISYPLQRDDALEVIRSTCNSKQAELIIPDLSGLKITKRRIDGTEFSYKGIDFNLHLAGDHIVYNAITAIEAVLAVIPDIDYEFISSGVSKVKMPARTEVLGYEPTIILDGGHNEDCAKALRKYIDDFLGSRKIIMVSSLMNDKEYDKYLEILLPAVNKFIAAKADVPRAAEVYDLISSALKYCNNCIPVPDPIDAVNKALDEAGNDDAVIVCGSFYLAGEVRNHLIERINNRG